MRADELIVAEDEIEDDLLDFEEGDDLEPELGVALSWSSSIEDRDITLVQYISSSSSCSCVLDS